AWLAWSYGVRALAITACAVIGAALACGYALPVALPNGSPPTGVLPDSAAAGVAPVAPAPFRFLEIARGETVRIARLRAFRTTLTNELGEPQWFLIAACGAIGSLALAGLIARLLGPIGTTDCWLTLAEQAPSQPAPAAGRLTTAQLALAGA